MKKVLLPFLVLLISVVTHAQTVPNGDFENWSSINFDNLNGWYNSNSESIPMFGVPNATKVTGYNSTSAIRLETKISGSDTSFAYIINTQGDPLNAEGGVPYSQMPMAIGGYARYNIATGDSALILVIFKKSGAPISFDIIMIGGSQSTFTSFSYPVIIAPPQTPDSVIIAVASSNAISMTGVANGSWIEIDSLRFLGPGITQPIPNGNFENWTPMSVDKLTSWFMGNGDGVTKTTDKYMGNFAVKLETKDYGGGNIGPGVMSTSKNIGPGPQNGGYPYTLTSDTIRGYYKYATSGNDTAMISVNLTNNGGFVGGGAKVLPPAATYTYFTMPFSAVSTPDSLRVDIYSSDMSGTPTAGSTLYIDRLDLKSQPLNVPGLSLSKQIVFVYPNPANDVLNVRVLNTKQGTMDVAIYDATGRVVFNNTYTVSNNSLVAIPVKELASGIYQYTIQVDDNITGNKFIKE
jgi:hypothetical protein